MLAILIDFVRTALKNPREAVQEAMAFPLSDKDLLWAGGSCVILAVFLNQLVMALLGAEVMLPEGSRGIVSLLVGSPLAFAGFNLGIFALAVILTERVGGALEGQGTRRGAIAVVSLVAVLGLAVTAVESALLVISPGMAAVVSLVSSAWLFYVLAAGISEIHRFENIFAVMGGIVATGFLCIILFSFVLLLTGFGP